MPDARLITKLKKTHYVVLVLQEVQFKNVLVKKYITLY